MLGVVPSSEAVSTTIVKTALPLLAKETHDAAMSILADSLTPHVVCCLKAETTLPNDTVSVAAKEMTSAKPAVRRAFCSLVGSALWELDDALSPAAVSFAKAVVPAFETNLKTISANPLNATAGALEGYVAVAILLGPLSRSKQFGNLPFSQFRVDLLLNRAIIILDDVIAGNPTLQSLCAASPKPSFLLWDKVYQKTTGEEDERWLLRATEAVLSFFKDEIIANEPAR